MAESAAHEKLEKAAVKKAFPAKFAKFAKAEASEDKVSKGPKKAPKK